MSEERLNKTARETRKKIKAALLKLFETKKIDTITVMDIHQETGYSRQTFYRHYKGVNEVFEDIVNDKFDDFVQNWMNEKIISLNSFLCSFFTWARKNREDIELYLDGGAVDGLIKCYYTLALQILDKVILPEAFNDQGEHYKAKLTVLGVIMSMAYYWFMNGFHDTPEQIAEYIESKLNL